MNLPNKTLLLVTRDEDLLSVVPWINGSVYAARDFTEARQLLDELRGWAVLAIGPDQLLPAAVSPFNYPFCVAYTDRAFLNMALLAHLHPQGIYELPAEIDWLHDRLGVYAAPR